MKLQISIWKYLLTLTVVMKYRPDVTERQDKAIMSEQVNRQIFEKIATVILPLWASWDLKIKLSLLRKGEGTNLEAPVVGSESVSFKALSDHGMWDAMLRTVSNEEI